MTAVRTFGRRGAGDAGVAPPATVEDAGLAARRAAFLAEERSRAGQPREEPAPTSFGERSAPIFVREKSLGTAYLLWFVLGGFGAHRFYLGFPVSASIQAMLWLPSYMLIAAGFFGAIFPMAIGALWILADVFLIPSLARQANDRARQSAIGYTFA